MQIESKYLHCGPEHSLWYSVLQEIDASPQQVELLSRHRQTARNLRLEHQHIARALHVCASSMNAVIYSFATTTDYYYWSYCNIMQIWAFDFDFYLLPPMLIDKSISCQTWRSTRRNGIRYWSVFDQCWALYKWLNCWCCWNTALRPRRLQRQLLSKRSSVSIWDSIYRAGSHTAFFLQMHHSSWVCI